MPLVLAGATSGSTTLTPVDAVTATITLPSATCTLAGVGVNVGSQITNSLSGNVAVNNTASYFTGPTVAQGTTGTWFVSGTVTFQNGASASNVYFNLTDGSVTIASACITTSANNTWNWAVSLSGVIASPAGNLRIQVRDSGHTDGFIVANTSGLTKDSTITAFRIG